MEGEETDVEDLNKRKETLQNTKEKTKNQRKTEATIRDLSEENKMEKTYKIFEKKLKTL